jgi:hypothetical protein
VTPSGGKALKLLKATAEEWEAVRAGGAVAVPLEVSGEAHTKLTTRDVAAVSVLDPTIVELCERFLQWMPTKKINPYGATTITQYKSSFKMLCTAFGKVRLSELAERHIEKAVEDNGWGEANTTKNVKRLKTAINWTIKRDRLKITNPLDDFVLVPVGFKDSEILAKDEAIIQAHGGKAFLVFYNFCRRTGARPGEIASICAEGPNTVKINAKGEYYFHLPCWKNAKKMKRADKRIRIIRFGAELQAVVKELLAAHPTGYLFRTKMGKKWIEGTWRPHFRYLIEKYALPASITMYSARHQWFTDGINRGENLSDLADLGGTSITMIEQHYSHTLKQAERLQEAANRLS